MKNHERNTGERGAALISITVVVLIVAVLVASFFQVNLGAAGEQRRQERNLDAFYLAEAGLNECYAEMKTQPSMAVTGLGSEQSPIEFGSSQYWVDIENMGMRVYALRSTGVEARVRDRVEMVVREVPDGFFRYAVFGDDQVILNTSSFVDSYDSDIGTYQSQYDTSLGYADENGTVGSNNDITLRANSDIHGDAVPGPDGVVDDSASQTYISGSTAPAEELVELPPIQVPSVASSGTALYDDGNTHVLGPGDVHFDSLEIKAGTTLKVIGPCRLVLDDFTLNSNTTMSVNTDDGPIEIYATGDLDLRSNSILETSTNVPKDLAFYVSSSNLENPKAEIHFAAQSEYYGLIYAPDAEIEIHAMFEIYGSVMARRVKLGSNSSVHYDTSLLFDDENGPPVYETVSWRPVALQ